MTKFRFHRGSLADSMVTCIEVGSLYELREHIEEADSWPATEDSLPLHVEPYGRDYRTKWDTYIVKYDGQVIGFTDGPLE